MAKKKKAAKAKRPAVKKSKAANPKAKRRSAVKWISEQEADKLALNSDASNSPISPRKPG